MVEFDKKRAGLILLALFFGGAVPIQLLTVSFGYAQYVKGVTKMGPAIPVAHEFAVGVYVPFILFPSLIALIAIAAYSRKAYPDLHHRIIVGAATGAVATMALDVVRLTGVVHGWLPMDTPFAFGKMLTGSDSLSVLYPVGVTAHYMFGANFGIFFAFVFGRGRTAQVTVVLAVVWALIIEFGMMTLPPMGPAVGLFGVDFKWPQLFLLTFVAHIFFGVALGLLSHQFLNKSAQGWLLPFLRGTNTTLEQNLKRTPAEATL